MFISIELIPKTRKMQIPQIKSQIIKLYNWTKWDIY